MIHSISDLALQNEWIGKYKSPLSTWIGADNGAHTIWPVVLWGHGLINGCGVWLISGNVWLGLAEACAHSVIDYGSTSGYYGLFIDQCLHFACKCLWAFIILRYL